MKKIRMLIMVLLIIATALSFAACMDDLGGKNGIDGIDGADGIDGNNGLSAYELYIKQYPDYEGNEEQWVDDLSNGNLARFTVTFDSNGGSEVEPLLKVKKGTLIEEPYVFHKEYENVDWYKIEGWYKDNGFNDKWDFDADTVKSDITLYAKWPTFTKSLEFELINNDTEYAVKGIGVAADSDIIIPSKYNGLPVTTIGGFAFYYCTNLAIIHVKGYTQKPDGWSIRWKDRCDATVHWDCDCA